MQPRTLFSGTPCRDAAQDGGGFPVVSLALDTGYKLRCLRHPSAPRQTSDRLTRRILKAVFLELCPGTLPQVVLN